MVQVAGRVKGYALVGVAAALWGTIGIAGRVLYAAGIGPAQAVTVRVAGAALLLAVALAAARPAWLRIALRDVPYFVAYGLVSVAAYNLLYFEAVRRIPVAAAAVLLYTAPAFVALIARVAFREPLTVVKGAAIALTLAGCALVAGAHRPEVWSTSAPGLLFGIGAGLTYGLYGVFGKHALRRYGPWTVQAHSLLAGAAALVLAFGPETVRALASAPGAWAAAAYLSLVPTLLAYGAYLSGLRHIPASHASVVATVEPVVAALLGAALLGEPLAATRVAGMALVLAGVLLLQRGAAGEVGRPAQASGPAGAGGGDAGVRGPRPGGLPAGPRGPARPEARASPRPGGDAAWPGPGST